MQKGEYKTLLQKAGFRATPGKIALLELLQKEDKPLTVAEIQKKLKRKQDTVTLYRSLEALTEANILMRSELGHGHAHYELSIGKKHHHHLVCTNCEKVEDFSDPSLETALTKAAKNASSFKSINSHSLELFGLCARCS
ncbi:transcriptional repressor [Patescibacteria group bacterium]|nr:transcriptional repressor [Patescibacteria group bacterium]